MDAIVQLPLLMRQGETGSRLEAGRRRGRSRPRKVAAVEEIDKSAEFSISELTKADAQTLRFTPFGLSLQGTLRPEDSLKYLQSMLDAAQLASGIPADIRTAFERVRRLHTYGLFEYGFFTLADNAIWLLPESALGVRFIEHYNGSIPFRHGADRSTLEAARFETVGHALGARGHLSRRRGWALEDHADYGEGRGFDGSYRSLMEWARREGLLSRWLDHRWAELGDGARYAVATQSKPPDYALPDNWSELDEAMRRAWWTAWRRDVWDAGQTEVFVQIRNLIAHPSTDQTLTPIQSAQALRAVAEFLNHLWPGPGDSEMADIS